jgi:hypothetical protein
MYKIRDLAFGTLVPKGFLTAAAVVATLVSASGASAAVQSAVIDGITVTDAGRVSPAGANGPQPGTASGLAQMQIGQTVDNPPSLPGPVTTGNPPPLGNPGWDPFGTADQTHTWWNVESGAVTLNATSDTLEIVWGSPNNQSAQDGANIVAFYNGPNASVGLIGEVLASDLYADFTGVTNTTEPGYLIGFAAPGGFQSVVFTTGASDFEFAIVPEASTWAMMLIGFAGLGFAGCSRTRKERLATTIA